MLQYNHRRTCKERPGGNGREYRDFFTSLVNLALPMLEIEGKHFPRDLFTKHSNNVNKEIIEKKQSELKRRNPTPTGLNMSCSESKRLNITALTPIAKTIC